MSNADGHMPVHQRDAQRERLLSVRDPTLIFVHHVQDVSCAAVIGDARAIKKELRAAKQKFLCGRAQATGLRLGLRKRPQSFV